MLQTVTGGVIRINRVLENKFQETQFSEELNGLWNSDLKSATPSSLLPIIKWKGSLVNSQLISERRLRN
jgi:hypothetical protein